LTQIWPAWHSVAINGLYPLRRILHASDHGAVFLTESKTQNGADAAIKIVRTERGLADLQLRHWKAAAALSHPRLARILDSGRCQLGGQQFLFVVTEYAEQTLAQVLPHRALTPDEARDLLLPTLDALSYLHRKGLVHGQLKPANVLVVNDQLKLATDTVRPAGELRARIAESSLYDPPEANHGRLTPPGDMWGLGVTMVEALTQCLPWPAEKSGSACLPPTLPADFVDSVQRCLSRDPMSRPTASDLQSRFSRAPPAPVLSAPVVPAPGVVVPEEPRRPKAAQLSRKAHPRMPAIVAASLLMLSLVVWIGVRLFHGNSNSPPVTSSNVEATPQAPVAPVTTPQTAPPTLSAPRKAFPPSTGATPRERKAAPSRPSTRHSDRPAQSSLEASAAVLHKQIPAVSPSALRTIHGHVKVGVFVMVDRSGKVIDALLENPGPSSYFAHLARDAARQWTFAPANTQDPRSWLLRFEFSRDGATANAIPRS
jgi:serine/threonine protein kinase